MNPTLASNVDVVIDGVPDLPTVLRIEAAVREAAARAAIAAKCTIAVAPAKAHGGWEVGVIAAGQRIYASLRTAHHDRATFTNDLTRMLQSPLMSDAGSDDTTGGHVGCPFCGGTMLMVSSRPSGSGPGLRVGLPTAPRDAAVLWRCERCDSDISVSSLNRAV